MLRLWQDWQELFKSGCNSRLAMVCLKILITFSMHRFHVQDSVPYGISIRRRFVLDPGEFMSTTSVFTLTCLPLYLILICKIIVLLGMVMTSPSLNPIVTDRIVRMKASSIMQNDMPVTFL